MGINALVVGSGSFVTNPHGFGRYYASILASRDDVDRLILTRTTMEGADETADYVRHLKTCKAKEVIGAEVHDEQSLKRALEFYKPSFIAIVAKDKDIANDIHHPYTLLALDYGDVLCEKPYVNARGQYGSMFMVKQLEDKLEKLKGKHTFGMELPLAVIAKHIWDEELLKRFETAKRLDFHWNVKGSKSDIIDNLVLHPWSLIPGDYKIKVEYSELLRDGQEAFIKLLLYNPGKKHKVKCEITLKYGGNFTGFAIDDYVIGLKRQGAINTVLHLGNDTMTLERAAEIGNDALKGKELLTVDNPLEQHIASIINKQPIAGIGVTLRSQQLLEELHVYK